VIVFIGLLALICALTLADSNTWPIRLILGFVTVALVALDVVVWLVEQGRL